MAPGEKDDVPFGSHLSNVSDDSADELLKTPERVTINLLKNTPMVRTENSCKHLFMRQDAEALQGRLASEMRNWCDGPMPSELFLRNFFPISSKENPAEEPEKYRARMVLKLENEFISVPIEGISDESALYGPIVRHSLLSYR